MSAKKLKASHSGKNSRSKSNEFGMPFPYNDTTTVIGQGIHETSKYTSNGQPTSWMCNYRSKDASFKDAASSKLIINEPDDQ